MLVYLFISSGEVQAAMAATTTSKHRMQRVIATDGSGEALTGVCVFFLRTNNSKPVTTANMVEVRKKVEKQRFEFLARLFASLSELTFIARASFLHMDGEIEKVSSGSAQLPQAKTTMLEKA